MLITLVNQTQTRFSEKNLQNSLDIILKVLSKNKSLKNLKKIQREELTLVFVSAPHMKKMNHQFRGKDYATDVLSFASSSSESLGELIFCPAVLKKQARQNLHSIDHEFLYLLIHGILHLLGYDHEMSQPAAKKMFLLQDRLFSQLTAAKINLKLLHVNRRRAQ